RFRAARVADAARALDPADRADRRRHDDVRAVRHRTAPQTRHRAPRLRRRVAHARVRGARPPADAPDRARRELRPRVAAPRAARSPARRGPAEGTAAAHGRRPDLRRGGPAKPAARREVVVDLAPTVNAVSLPRAEPAVMCRPMFRSGTKYTIAKTPCRGAAEARAR